MGVDQSLSSTGYAYCDATGVVSGTIATGKLRGPHRLSYIRNKLVSLLDEVGPELVVFEDYAMGFRSGTGKLAHLGEVGGLLKLAVWEKGIDMLVVSPATMKLLIAGKGNAKKEQVRVALFRTYGYNVIQEDEADALGLMLVGEAKLGSGEVRMNPKHLASLDRCEIVSGRRKLA